MARGKLHGRLFLRGGVWYMRWRSNGRECTRTTGIADDGTQATRNRAEQMLESETEVLRLRDRAARLVVVKRMLETTEEEIRDRLSGIRRSAVLSELDALFRGSAFRVDCSESQLETYSRYIGILVKTLGGDTVLSDIDVRIAGNAATRFSVGRSPNTYNKYLNGLSFVWRAVMPSIGVVYNPWEPLPRKKLDTCVRRALTQEEIERIFATAKGEVRVLFAVGLYTGLRLSDAISLTWGDIKGDVVYVKTMKTGSKVAIPVHPRLRKALGARGRAEDLVCPGLYEVYRRQGRSSISKKYRRLFTRCGIDTSLKVSPDGMARPLCGFHSLRHTFVSMCTAAGVDRTIVQALVGHSSAKMTEHYTHLDDAVFLREFARIGQRSE